jgi:hypothetical protein
VIPPVALGHPPITILKLPPTGPITVCQAKQPLLVLLVVPWKSLPPPTWSGSGPKASPLLAKSLRSLIPESRLLRKWPEWKTDFGFWRTGSVSMIPRP